MNLVPCPECKKTEWEEFEPYCEDCGNHSGYRCTGCDHQVDHVWDQDLYGEIKNAAEENVNK